MPLPCPAAFAFQSTLPARGATQLFGGFSNHFCISIHAPRTGSDSRQRQQTAGRLISIHAPRTGSDLLCSAAQLGAAEFQSTLPARGATLVVSVGTLVLIISIHAPRTGSDASAQASMTVSAHFNPRSPHGERRHGRWTWFFRLGHFNPRSPHGERPVANGSYFNLIRISIHAPRTGSDMDVGLGSFGSDISIHAPRTGSDVTYPARFLSICHFNPRSPHGERRSATGCQMNGLRFQSTLPARGATQEALDIATERLFQSTLPARGATGSPRGDMNAERFQSTLPARGATLTM